LKQLIGLLPTRGQVSSVRSLFAGWTALNWASLPVTDRRWTAPLAATAVGMGLFIGVAIGPGIGQTVGAAQQIIQLPATADSGGGKGVAATGDAAGPPALQGPVANLPNATASSPASPVPSATPPVVPSAPPAVTTSTETTPATTTPEDTEEPAPPEQPEEELVYKGTVLHLNEPAGSYVLTTGKGQMNAIHAKELPKAGAKLEVPVRELANGTYAEDGKQTPGGSAEKAKFQGTVTYADAATGAYTVSRKGASVLVHADPAAQPPPAPPEVGAQVTVSAKIGAPPADPSTVDAPPQADPPPTTDPLPTPTTPTSSAASAPPSECGTPPEPPEPAAAIVTEVSHAVDIEFLGYSDFAGIVQGVCTDGGELILSADDLRESGTDLTLPLGEDAGIDLSGVEPGDVVNATAVIDQDTGALSLTGISSDEGIKGADDGDLAQGDQAG
jgi:hypothetical protein